MKNIILILFAFWGTSLHAQNTIKGRVTESSGTPVINAHVQLGNTGAYTDMEGNFLIENLESGGYELTVSHISFVGYSEEINIPTTKVWEIVLYPSSMLAEQVIIEATRADENTPTTYYNISKEELEKSNFGQDVPVLLEFTPSVVSTSDAGAGVGYTGIRIRGSDPTRINVTINGVPINDSESHGVYWVNTPDLSSSTSSIQIQRGVGTSTNGAAAFGATINLLTDSFTQEAYAEYSGSAGSYNTFKNTIQFGTGLLGNRWSFDGRLSAIQSDGYIDRASSDLKSYYFSGHYNGKKTIVKFLTFAGKERTYQSWWGTPQARLENDVDGMNFVADYNGYSNEQRTNLLNSGRTFNYYLYENEVDNYSQDHYQLHINSVVSSKIMLNAALHYTYGRGYFEQYRIDDDFSEYDIDPLITTSGTIESSDIIRRRWLDNHFYGMTFSLINSMEKSDIILGGGINQYDGDHFGEVIWSQYAPNIPKDYRYYDNNADKLDANVYLKAKYELMEGFRAFADLQVRSIDYKAVGPDNDRVGAVPVQINVDEQYTFFNPKVGINYVPEPGKRIYLSYAIAHREPVRSDFIDNQSGTTPRPEILRNLELGYERSGESSSIQLNGYFMDYKDQLVLTGALNDVGASIRANVDQSYRAGLELVAEKIVSDKLTLSGNASLSSNKIVSYDEVLYDYGINFDEFNVETTTFENTDIAFSPTLISSVNLSYQPLEALETSLIGKYVGKQFLDNTSNPDRSIPSYFVGYFRASYLIRAKGLKELRVGILVNNLFNELYENNGYTYGYKGGGVEVRENYFYPQAERNFLLSLNLKF